MKILILKPSALGDVVQALPVLRLLKRHDPRHEIHWWIDSALAPLLEGDRDLARVIPFHRRRWAKPRYWGELLASVRALRRERYDLAIDLQGLARSGTVAWLVNAGLTVGVDDLREGASGFYDWAVARPGVQAHAVDWYLEVVRRLSVPVDREFEWMPRRKAVWAGLVEKWPEAGSGSWCVINPGARWDNKRWPADRYAQLAAALARERPGLRFALMGSGEDRELTATIEAALPGRAVDLAGRTSLPEMVEWLRLAEFVVTNDTGPMHVAAALGRPVVALFGPTNPLRTGPYGQLGHVLQARLPCVPCMKGQCSITPLMACLYEIRVDDVLAAVRRLPGIE